MITRAVRPVVLVRAEDGPFSGSSEQGGASAEAAGREIVVGQHGAPEDSAGEVPLTASDRPS